MALAKLRCSPRSLGSIATADGSRKLQMGKSVDKPHVVYAGTKLVMVTEAADESQIATSRIPEPEPGAVLEGAAQRRLRLSGLVGGQ